MRATVAPRRSKRSRIRRISGCRAATTRSKSLPNPSPDRCAASASRSGLTRTRLRQPCVRVLRRDAERRPHDDDVARRQVDQRDGPHRRAPDRAPFPRRERRERRRRASLPATARLPAQAAGATRDSIRRARPRHRCCRRPVPPASESACESRPAHPPADRCGPGAPQCRCRLPGQVLLSQRHHGRIAREGERLSRRRFDHERVVKRDGLEDGPELVIAIAAAIEHTQIEIQLRVARRIRRIYVIVDCGLWIVDRIANSLRVAERPRRAQLLECDRNGVWRHVDRERRRRQLHVRLHLTQRQPRIDRRR